jgi:hypothetical protein
MNKQEFAMTRSEFVIEQALSAVAHARAARARDAERRAQLQMRAEVAAKPLYILKKYGGRQLDLKLDS